MFNQLQYIFYLVSYSQSRLFAARHVFKLSWSYTRIKLKIRLIDWLLFKVKRDLIQQQAYKKYQICKETALRWTYQRYLYFDDTFVLDIVSSNFFGLVWLIDIKSTSSINCDFYFIIRVMVNNR